MSEKIRVGILGGTGMVGQRFISLLENHPWFEVTTIAASPRSAGKTYEQAVGDRWKMDTPMPEAVKNIVVMNVNEVEQVASQVDFVFSAVDMTKEEIKKIEEDYAKTETPVVSNNSAHRWTPDVPMVVPEINPQHMEVIKYQKERLGTKRGFVAVKPNCSIQSYAPVLTAWKEFEPYEVVATTYQAISGAGKTFKDWPEMAALADNLILKVVSEIHDPVTTTDELIPSGETSSYRSNPLGLAEFTLSRKDPEYVGRAKAIQAAQKAIQAGNCPAEAVPELKPVIQTINKTYPDVDKTNLGVGSTIFAVKPGDGSAREQAASCQKVLGGWANIANEYATKRYRSNLINWGMLPFIIDEGGLPFTNGDYIFIPEIAKAVKEKTSEVKAYVVNKEMKEFTLRLGELTDDERQIILDGCLINFYRNHQ